MKNLYVDMDGVLAEFKNVPLNALYKPGYFRNLVPVQNVINGLEIFIKAHPEVNVSVLSCILKDRPYAKDEKHEWLNEYCPFLKENTKLFIPCGISKKTYLNGGENYLLDDHSPNIIDFDDGKDYHGIKLLNGINGMGVKWKGNRLEYSLPPDEFASKLYDFMKDAA